MILIYEEDKKEIIFSYPSELNMFENKVHQPFLSVVDKVADIFFRRINNRMIFGNCFIFHTLTIYKCILY